MFWAISILKFLIFLLWRAYFCKTALSSLGNGFLICSSVSEFSCLTISLCVKVNLTTDYDERYFHGKPQNSFHKSVNIPDVVVFPRSEEEVSKILKSCNKYKRVKALHVEDMDVVVEPGIGWLELNDHYRTVRCVLSS
ncbi:hypothetical protein EUTSA_v10014980mg [Eutrema salsugineum]|uniref:FAD linked oxidase N-terminal domain-containing protein n=1 Tax=Eutrema salsugineum TaxID=72664 RepID=V4LAF8_EUTSA|nr:hypothetical protein EUTSA_v10014980mg [Eutrema salsugineum]